jgi:hypothetical protein
VSETRRAVDAVALASVISSAVVGLAGASVAFYGARRTAKTDQEGRGEQRAADGYLKVPSLAEQEAQWLNSRVYNLGLDRQDLEYGVVSWMKPPKPELADRATGPPAHTVRAFLADPTCATSPRDQARSQRTLQ